MNAHANFLAVNPMLRERNLDWEAIRRRRELEGFEWAEGARQAHLRAMARLAETAAEVAIAKQMLAMGGGK